MEEISCDESSEAVEQLPREAVAAPSPKCSRFDGILSNQVEGAPAYGGRVE